MREAQPAINEELQFPVQEPAEVTLSSCLSEAKATLVSLQMGSTSKQAIFHLTVPTPQEVKKEELGF